MSYDLRENVELIGYSTNQIVVQNNLPTIRQVLAVFFYNLRRVSKLVHESAQLAVEECLIFWRKARIPTQESKKCVRKLESLYEKWRNIRKSSNRRSETQKKNEDEFKNNLNLLFDIAKENALELMTDQDDKDFFLHQKGQLQNQSKVSSFVSVYKADGGHVLPMEIDESLEKEPTDSAAKIDVFSRDVQNNDQLNSADGVILDSILSNPSTFDASKFNENELPAISESSSKTFENLHSTFKRVRKSVQSSTVPKGELDLLLGPESESPEFKNTPPPEKRATESVMSTKLSVILDKCKISKRNAVHILNAAAEAFNVDRVNVILNPTSIYEARKQFRKERYEAIKKLVPTLFSNLPTTIHWDGKMFQGKTRPETEERLAIIITSQQMEQMLGVPVISSSSGKNQADAVFETLVEWALYDNIQALCCDSTASNTGRIQGACTRLETLLGKDLLYFICRHHMYELVLKGAFEVKFGSTSSPDVPIFKNFENFWRTIDKNKYETGISDKFVNESLQSVIKEVLTFCLEHLKKDHARGDYKEFLELVVIFLGGKLPRGPTSFYIPGPVHHARWMAKCIYCLKMFIFRKQFLSLNKDFEIPCRDMCIFIVRLYVKAWFRAPNTALAPCQDLQFLKDLYNYRSMDEGISNRTLKKFVGHLWYLVPEMVALSFFDPTLSNEEKSRMVKSLESENSKFVFEKRILLNEKNIADILQADISDFVSKKSLYFFKRFDINTSFFKKNPLFWSKDKSFIEGLKVVKNLKSVNDSAERGVKLISDFNKIITKDETHKQYLIHVVQEYRALFPDCKKETLMQIYS